MRSDAIILYEGSEKNENRIEESEVLVPSTSKRSCDSDHDISGEQDSMTRPSISKYVNVQKKKKLQSSALTYTSYETDNNIHKEQDSIRIQSSTSKPNVQKKEKVKPYKSI